jgi:large subunit ribosomal protein L2
MALKEYKPTSSARRHMTVSDFAEITKTKPERKLTRPMKKSGGRNAHGHITTRHIGGGHKRRYRVIDFKRNKDGVPAKVAAIEYDPNRTARLALLHYADGEKRYILAPVGVNVGDVLLSGETVDIRPGNTLPVKSIPLGTVIHGVETQPGSGAKMIRTAGSFGQLMAKEGAYARSACPPARSGWCCRTARRPSGSWATWRAPRSGWARPARAAGSASGPRSAAWP